MRIALDVSPLARNRAGIGTHVANLLTALVQLAPDHKFFFYTSLPLPEKDHAFFNMRPHVRIVRCPSFLMGLRALWDRVDIFHGLNYKLRGWGRHGGVVTIHDLALDRLSLPSRKLFGQQRSFLRTRKTALRASRVVAVSEHSANDISELYGVPRERIVVVPNAVSPEFYPVHDPALKEQVRACYGIRREGFVLSGGGTEPRKNIVGLIEGFGRAPRLREKLNLVVVGGMERGVDAIWEAVRRARLEEAVIFPGYVPLEDLRVLYSSCALFAFPSLYEGFGMPVLEAMSCGAPVVSSNASSLPEVVGDGALLVDPRDPEAWAQAMTRVFEDANLRDDLRRRGALRVKAFSWEQSARNLLR
ncbi:MAG TPA: glycosyltransferase family 1 protein, partial [Nitrospirales bacterium]